jgi:hypothetical protein
MDAGDFGSLTINQAITIANEGVGVASSPQIVIGAAAADAVILRGLTFNAAPGVNLGVIFQAGSSLLIDHCAIQGYAGGPGIEFVPINPVRLRVLDTVLSNNGTSTFPSVLIKPATGGNVSAQFERVQILNAVSNGIRVDGTNSGAGATTVELHDVTVDAAAGGSGIVAVSAASGGAPVTIMATDVSAVNNAGYGLRAVGATATVLLRRSTIVNNNIGIGASSGGTMASFGDNTIRDNVVDGNPTSTLPLK